MKYSTMNKGEASAAILYLTQLVRDEKVVEVKEVKPRRSLNQNSYLHLLLGAFGAHFGYSLEEAKTIYKQLNASIYEYSREVRGKQHTFYRSSAELDKAEMTKSIDTLREWSAKAGYPLPSAVDQDWLRQIENEVEQHGSYL